MRKMTLWKGRPPLWPAGSEEAYPFLEVDETAEDGQPFVLVCPGGGYHWLAPHEGHPVADVFRAGGFAAAVLSYRVAGEKTAGPLGQGPLLDAQRAIRLIRQKYGKGRKIVLLGFSAGGHLSACAGVHQHPLPDHPVDELEEFSTRPDALVLCYPWLSVSRKVHQRSIDTLCGLNDAAGLHGFFDLEKKAGATTPPAFIWHTADDAVVPVENALYFAEALSGLQVPFALHVFPKGVHGLGLAGNDEVVSIWPGLCLAWLKSLSELRGSV